MVSLSPSSFYCSGLLNLRWTGTLNSTTLTSMSCNFPLQWEVSLVSPLFLKQLFVGVRSVRLSGQGQTPWAVCDTENWLLSVKQLCNAGLEVGRLWEAGSGETCLCIALQGGVWVSGDTSHDGCAGHALCYLGAIQERTCSGAFIRTYFLLIINAWFCCAAAEDLHRSKTKEPIQNHGYLKK